MRASDQEADSETIEFIVDFLNGIGFASGSAELRRDRATHRANDTASLRGYLPIKLIRSPVTEADLRELYFQSL